MRMILASCPDTLGRVRVWAWRLEGGGGGGSGRFVPQGT